MSTPLRAGDVSILALSPLTAPVRRRDSTVLYGNPSPDGLNSAVVLFDHERHALVARHVDPQESAAMILVPSALATAALTPPPASNRCPMCNSVLGGSPSRAPYVSESYFPTLAYMHRRLPATVANLDAHVNPFSPAEPSVDEAAAALHDISPDLLVNGYYQRFFREVRKIGTGSFGSVFLCQHVIDQVFLGEFAVKKVPVGDSRQWLRGMMREVKALERLAAHPNIVSYKHSWLEMNRANELCPYVPFLYILMSFCDSGSLEDLLFTDPTTVIPDSTVWPLFLDVTQGLQHLHRNFILHRDLKPSNILLTSDSRSTTCGVRAVLTDFGTAELVSSTNTDSPIHSGFTGTVEFTAPEVLSANPIYSEKSDMWSLGVVLFAMCFNKVPFSDKDPLVCARHIIDHPVHVPQMPQRDNNLIHLITALTAQSARDRPSCDDILFHPSVREKIDDRFRTVRY